jgi:uncharacterized membrane protein YbhN (UPF0104 family)
MKLGWRSQNESTEALLKHGLFLALGGIALYLLAPQLSDVIRQVPNLRTIRPVWFLIMLLSETLSFVFVWVLIRTALPGVSWFVAACAQTVSNAVSRVVPGGAAVGGATMYRVLSVSGVRPGEAAAGLAATSAISTAALFSIPAAALVLAFLGAPIPELLWPAAVAGGVLFGLLVSFGLLALKGDAALHGVGRFVNFVLVNVSSRTKNPRSFDPDRLLLERDTLVSSLGDSWTKAVLAAAANWAFDYLTLVAALYAVGADPRLSLVLLAYAGAAVLTMIPLTPGGLGFVEGGLTWLLVVSGISFQNALLATLAYRIVSLWLPILAGPVAWVAFRNRYPGASGINGPVQPTSDEPDTHESEADEPEPDEPATDKHDTDEKDSQLHGKRF